MIIAATFAAKYLVLLFPVVAWGTGCGERRRIWPASAALSAKSAIALLIGFAASWIIGTLWPHARPFAEPFGHSFMIMHRRPHSRAITALLCLHFALGCLFWCNVRAGLLLMIRH